MNDKDNIEFEFPSADPDTSVCAPTVGVYSILQGVTIGLFVHVSGLFVWLDGSVLEVGDDLTIDHVANGSRARLVVRNSQRSRVLEYTRESPVSTPFYSEDQEDADFGLWFYNVLNSEERRQIVVSNWSRNSS